MSQCVHVDEESIQQITYPRRELNSIFSAPPSGGQGRANEAARSTLQTPLWKRTGRQKNPTQSPLGSSKRGPPTDHNISLARTRTNNAQAGSSCGPILLRQEDPMTPERCSQPPKAHPAMPRPPSLSPHPLPNNNNNHHPYTVPAMLKSRISANTCSTRLSR